MTKSKEPLPETLSGLLSLAVKECRKVDEEIARGEPINWDHEVWYVYDEDEGCFCCMAGAVLRGRGGMPTDMQGDGSQGVWMNVINKLREGDVGGALLRLGVPFPRSADVERLDEWFTVHSLEDSDTGLPEGQYLSWDDYDRFADELEKEGL